MPFFLFPKICLVLSVCKITCSFYDLCLRYVLSFAVLRYALFVPFLNDAISVHSYGMTLLLLFKKMLFIFLSKGMTFIFFLKDMPFLSFFLDMSFFLLQSLFPLFFSLSSSIFVRDLQAIGRGALTGSLDVDR